MDTKYHWRITWVPVDPNEGEEYIDVIGTREDAEAVADQGPLYEYECRETVIERRGKAKE